MPRVQRRGQSSQESYRFSLINGEVRNLQELKNGVWRRESIDADELWAFDGSQLIRHEFKLAGVERKIYSDRDGDGVYTRTGRDFVTGVRDGQPIAGPIDDDSYRFDVLNGEVTNIQELEDGVWITKPVKANEYWTFDGTTLIEHELEDGVIKRELHTDTDGDGVFTQVSQDLIPAPAGQPARPAVEDNSYRFRLVAGEVTDLRRFDDGVWKREIPDRRESWSFDGTRLLQTWVRSGGPRRAVYTDADGDGIFSRAGRRSLAEAGPLAALQSDPIVI